MAKFESHAGEALPAYPATVAKNEFGRVLDAALEHGAVAITRHDAVKAVLVSAEEYRRLKGDRPIDTLREEWDALYEEMQTPAWRKAALRAFASTPEELGRAAVKSARKRG
jgi:prevent-host-death family protein